MASSRRPTKAATHKIGEYNLISKFPGYNARSDMTTLPPGTLIPGSQNVIIKTSGRVATVKGYVLDGVGSATADSGILSNFDFNTFKSDVRNMRAGFLTSAGNDGKLQFRYRTGAGTNADPYVVHWVDLKTSLTTVRMDFTEYWDTTHLVKQLLWVDGSSNVFNWNGAVTQLASATAPVAGVITTVSGTPTNAGTGYAVGDILTITTGGTFGSVKVTAVDMSGAITTLILYEPGIGGYSVATGQATSGGTGTGATVNITAVAARSSITKQGTLSWAQEGFQQGGASIMISGGSVVQYTGMGTTTVLMGVDGDYSAQAVGTIINQSYGTTTMAAIPGMLATFNPSVIGCGRNNQVYYGSYTSNSLYISKVNNYADVSFTTPTRVVGEGDLIPLDAPPYAFLPQEVTASMGGADSYDMYISEGLDHWAVIRGSLSSDLTKESLEHIRLKTSPLQAAQSTRLVSKMKNHIVFVGHDNVANFLGYLSYENVPTLVDFSWPIIDDMNSYDFTDACVFYYRNYVYIAIPKHGIIRAYNMTDQTQQAFSSLKAIEDVTQQPWFWESPITFPLSGFYVVDGELYGHSYTSSESYKLFEGGSLNGQNIDAKAVFAFMDYGDRTQNKGSNEVWVEGYINQNTVLNVTVAGDLDSFQTSQTVTVNGSDASIVAFGAGAHSLGKNPLGSQPLGGAQTSTATMPAWFHVAKTYTQVPSYLEEVFFETNGVDLQWELICFGTNATPTVEGNNSITQ